MANPKKDDIKNSSAYACARFFLQGAQTTREPIEDFDNMPPIIAEPAWRFDAHNPNDGRNYVVFVNAQTGELQYFKWWRNSD